MDVFDFDGFLDHIDRNATQFCNESTISPNTCTKWKKQDSDESIRQESILKILVAYPKADVAKFFPTHREIVKLSKGK